MRRQKVAQKKKRRKKLSIHSLSSLTLMFIQESERMKILEPQKWEAWSPLVSVKCTKKQAETKQGEKIAC